MPITHDGKNAARKVRRTALQAGGWWLLLSAKRGLRSRASFERDHAFEF
jgi:hypothetical protein